MSETDKMMRIAGRKDDGTAGALNVNANGGIESNITGVDIAMPTDLQYHALADDNPIPVKEMSDFLELIDLASGEEIRDTSNSSHRWLIDARKYKKINAIWIDNLHDVELQFRVYFSYLNQYNGNNMQQINLDSYNKVPMNKRVRVDSVDIPKLNSSSIYVFLNFYSTTVPTTGSLTVKVEGVLR